MTSLFPRGLEKLASWSFTGDFGKTFFQLFDLQMWCFGRDIIREKGNLLLDCGFTRSRPVGNISGSTHYTKIIGVDTTINLWGFALIVVADRVGSICLKRHARFPVYSTKEEFTNDFWRPHEMPIFKVPKGHNEIGKSLSLMQICTDELASYERRILELEAPYYRAICAATRHKEREILKRTSLCNGWEELSKLIAKCTATSCGKLSRLSVTDNIEATKVERR